MYIIKFDRSRQLLHIRLSGFMSVVEVRDFGRAQQDAIVAMGCPQGGHLSLIETGEAFLQSQEVVQTFRGLIMASPRPSRALAIVTGTSLTRMQVRRILCHANARMFATVDEAKAWLFMPHVAAVQQRMSASA